MSDKEKQKLWKKIVFDGKQTKLNTNKKSKFSLTLKKKFRLTILILFIVLAILCFLLFSLGLVHNLTSWTAIFLALIGLFITSFSKKL